MKSLIAATLLVCSTLTLSTSASAKGCLAGAAVGGVAGHVAGHHSLIGAGVGCAVGRHRANKKEKELAVQQARQQNATAARGAAPTSAEPARK